MTPSAAGVASAIAALVSGAYVWSMVYTDEPGDTGGQSPVAIIHPLTLHPERFTAGAGVNKDRWVWEVLALIDRQQQTAAVAVAQTYAITDALRVAFQTHVQLGVAGGSILVAMLDHVPTRFGWRRDQGVLYRTIALQLEVYEEYTTAITT